MPPEEVEEGETRGRASFRAVGQPTRHEVVDGCVPRLPRRIPSLDGLRAISIALVMVAHLAKPKDMSSLLVRLRVDHLGNIGVKIFFEISGFLITTLLLRELSATGRINLAGFYRRRVLRIFPAYWAYLAALALLSAAGTIALLPGDMLHALTYTANYHHERSWQVNHLWSLSVEEQFYIGWPLLLWLVGVRRAAATAVAVAVLAPAVRAFMWFGLHSPESAMTREFQAICDALAVGCLLAICFNRLGASRRYQAFLTSPLFWAAVPAGVLFSVAGGMVWFWVIGQSILQLTIALCIDRCVRLPSDRVGRALNSKPFIAVGILSYSLYLWQMLFLNPISRSPINRFPLSMVLAFAAAGASYWLVERPFLKLKSGGRVHTPATAGDPVPVSGPSLP